MMKEHRQPPRAAWARHARYARLLGSFGAVAALAGCAAHGPAPWPAAPPVEAGEVNVVARAAEPVGDVQPIAVAITSGDPRTLAVDARQVYAHVDADSGVRVSPLPPGEAARRAGRSRLPGAVRGGATGAGAGAVAGAVGGVISGAIQGGIGLATALGSATGAALGAITGVLAGAGEPAPDVAGFSDRALGSGPLASGTSMIGYVYFPPGNYRSVELLLGDDHGETVTRSVALDSSR